MMRHELVLTLAFLTILVAEVFTNESKKEKFRSFGIVLFALVTAIGMLPAPEGTLFGGMYMAGSTT
ncbi:NADH-quinone oxidoreductase subunit N, partial [bacterium]|nr:NADH-quinone oxidoreductase subunit N [bacterium]